MKTEKEITNSAEEMKMEEERQKRQNENLAAEAGKEDPAQQIWKELEPLLDGIEKLLSPQKAESSEGAAEKKDSKEGATNDENLSPWELFLKGDFKMGVKKFFDNLKNGLKEAVGFVVDLLTGSSNTQTKEENQGATATDQKENAEQSREFFQKVGTQVKSLADTFGKALNPASKEEGEQAVNDLTNGFRNLGKTLLDAPPHLKKIFDGFLSKQQGNFEKFVYLLGGALSKGENKAALQGIFQGLNGFAKTLNRLLDGPKASKTPTTYDEEMKKQNALDAANGNEPINSIQNAIAPFIPTDSNTTSNAANSDQMPFSKPENPLVRQRANISI